MALDVTYKGTQIAQLTEDGNLTLETAGKYCEDDFELAYTGGGGASDTDAILIVTVPVGSTVTMSKGSVTITSTIWVQAANTTLECALFVIPAQQFDGTNAWTVTAIKGSQTSSKSVIIDSNKQYSVTMQYITYLLLDGTVYSGLGSFQNVSSSYFTNGIIGASSADSTNGNYWTFANKVPLRSFGKTLHVLMKVGSNHASDLPIRVGAFNTKPIKQGYVKNVSYVAAATSVTATSSSYVEHTVDISSLSTSSSYYLSCIAIAKYSVSKIWVTP